ncbi:MAG: hypothetical protein JWL86_5425 [Rhizobium sp.]|nr:hypothetical protein [Rhizobium sp.]
MLTWLLIVLIVLTAIAIYAFWIRPILRLKPSFAAYYAEEESFWAAVCLKFGGLKQKLTTAFITAMGVIVSLYDFLAPLVAQSGADVRTLTSRVPPQMWPFIGIALVALMQYFRNLADKKAALEAADQAIADAAPTAGKL